MRIDLLTFLVRDQDLAIAFFVDALGFELSEDTLTVGEAGRTRRWVVVRPPEGGTGLLLALATGEEQVAATGHQGGGRVGFFLHVADFAAAHARMLAAGVSFLEEPRHETYGTVAVFRDVSGNTWDLLGPARPD